jgi:glycosyltransferase involved in cell wall biosynthesis
LDNVISGLARDFELEFFIVTIDNVTLDQIEYLEKNFGKVHLFKYSLIEFGTSAIPTLWSGLPFQAESFHFRNAQQWLDTHIGTYNACYVHEIRMTEYFIKYNESIKKKILVDFNDAISLNYKTSLAQLSLPKKMFYLFEGHRVRRYESKVLESFYHFNVVSEHDRRYLLDSKFYTNEHEIDFACIHHGPQMGKQSLLDSKEKNIFFMGRLGYEPNRDALLFFLDEIWSDLKKAIPGITLYVLGKKGALQNYPEDSQIIFTGFVPEVWDVAQKCNAMIAPIRFAGGTPSKILEAMAMGIPVITTPAATAGIPGLEHEKNILIAPEHDTEKWVADIKKVFDNEVFRKTIGSNARAFAEQNYSSDQARQEFRDIFHKLTK